jgi:hypothetical protein
MNSILDPDSDNKPDSPERFREPEGREHLVYVDEWGRPDECTEDCPGCHWEGNLDCEALSSGCDLCDPDGWAVR